MFCKFSFLPTSKVRKGSALLLAVILLPFLFLAGSDLFRSSVSNAAEKESSKVRESEGHLIILHTNDHHGHLLPDSGDGLGGMARLSSLIQTLRRRYQDPSLNSSGTTVLSTDSEVSLKGSDFGNQDGREVKGYKNVLLIDAGDINTGTAASDLFDARPDFLVYNYWGYDFAVLGNHEFDAFPNRLSKQIHWARFPFLTSNVRRLDGRAVGLPWLILDYKFARIGFIGITVSSDKLIIQKDRDFRIEPEIETARQMTIFLKKVKKADLVIAVTHLGFTESAYDTVTSLELAQGVPDIDLIIDGHSHSQIDQPRYLGKIPIVTANCYGHYLGCLDLELRKGAIVGLKWICYPIDRTLPEDPEVNKIIAPFLREARQRLSETVTVCEEKFVHDDYPCRFREVPIGDMICDGIVQEAARRDLPVDFAFITGGNIRAGLPKGPVTLSDIVTVLPFRNRIWRLTLKGSDLLTLFQQIGSARRGSGSFAQVSREVHYKLTYNAKGAGSISDLLLNGKKIDPNRLYRIGTIDYLAEGGDGYDILKNSVQTDKTKTLLYESFAEYLRKIPRPIRPLTDSRIIIDE